MTEDDAGASRPTQLKTIVILFIILRLALLFMYTPQGLFNAYSDYYFYFRTSQLADRGYYPFVNMWYEYPPLSTYIVHAVYRLTQAILPVGDINSPGYQIYARLLGTTLLLFETGTLIMLHRIAAKTWGSRRADWLAWVYSALSLPLFFWNITHTTIMVFWLLVALEGLIAERWGRSALALGLAIAAKLTPVFLLGPVFKLLWPQRSRWVTYGLITGVTAAAAYLPLALLGGGPWIVASFVALGKVGSWSTPWALLDGNWGPGSFGLLSTRLDLAQASVARGQPAVVPAWLSLSLFAALYAAVFFRKLERRGPQQVIWFTTLTAMLFHLWSKGWSPQWAELIIPLLLLSFPDGRGLRLVLLLTLIVFVEWPLADAFGSHALLAAAALGRTLLFMVVGLRTARLLWPAANFANPAQ